MAGETLTEEQVNESEMNRFMGGSTTDGVTSDGDPTEDENAKAEAAATVAADAAAAAAANEATRKAAEEAAAGAKPQETPEAKAAREAEEARTAGKKSTSDRVRELNTKWREEQRARQAAEQELADLKAGKKPLTTQQDALKSELVAPDPKDFEFGELDAKYISALARYEVRLELAADRKVANDTKQTEAQAAAVAEFQERVDAFAEKGAEKFADFKDLVIEGAKAGDWDLTATVGELILESDFGHEIAHYLASNPDEASRIAALSASAQAAKFGRLEAKFEAEAAAPTSAQTGEKPVKTSKTPAPLKTPRSNAGQFQVDGSTKDFAAFEALAKAG